MPYVTYDELLRAFTELADAISEIPCGFSEFAGEHAADVRERLYEQEIAAHIARRDAAK